ncbi:MAG: tetratricopeptide repeat protein [Desulfonauticus sp.]|nr:tetratricopeptide repeat protein [Desulfonauticus sp.]
MSLIYKSLQKIKKQELKRNKSPVGIMPSPPQVIGKLLWTVLFIVLILGAGLLWTSIQVRLPQPKISALSEKKSVQKRVSQKSVPNLNSKASVTRKENSVIPVTYSGVKVKKLRPKPKKKLNPLQKQYTNAYQELKQHFLKQAKKNQQIALLNQELQKSFLENDKKAVKRNLKKLSQILGKDSFLVQKWKGIIALQDKDYTLAEKYFQKAISQNSKDVNCRINYIYALLGQKKIELARQEAQRLWQDFPDNSKVQDLVLRISNL